MNHFGEPHGRYHGEPRRGTIYRSRRGVIMGVFRGFADHFGVSVFWLRAVGVLFLLVTGVWPLAFIYLLAGLLMKPAPAVPLGSAEEAAFYDSYVSSRASAAARLKRKFDGLDRRIRRMEDVVTSRDYEWESRLNS